ncbi:hypothetical protein JR316_0005322 [Psilocybe cubensis]|uniref:Uncharacterized protein n=2 Tax=Psilocybe cubensis TaxID=181762 RepID=A0ACB8H5M1_PSICU|nr:hypothetical protein JR316_0005322 [Psilocybe cubensis]KAH9483218.1 hypothetical protein JR316_0005322 [Psilocybe cubensis]
MNASPDMKILSFEEILKIEAEVFQPSSPHSFHPFSCSSSGTESENAHSEDQFNAHIKATVEITKSRLEKSALALFDFVVDQTNWDMDSNLLQLGEDKISEVQMWHEKLETPLRDSPKYTPMHFASYTTTAWTFIHEIESLLAQYQEWKDKVSQSTQNSKFQTSSTTPGSVSAILPTAEPNSLARG